MKSKSESLCEKSEKGMSRVSMRYRNRFKG